MTDRPYDLRRTEDGRSVLSRQVGQYRDAFSSMINALDSPLRGGLRPLTVRDRESFAIALLDSTAIVTDILSFYQDRIFNEYFLGTAKTSPSLRGLARLVGYEFRPAKSAFVDLSIVIDETQSTRSNFNVEAGLKVRSIPKAGGIPQTFETLSDLEANPRWNEILPVRTERPWISIATKTLRLDPGTEPVSAGQMIGIYEQREDDRVRAISLNSGTWLLRANTVDKDDGGFSELSLRPSLTQKFPSQTPTEAEIADMVPYRSRAIKAVRAATHSQQAGLPSERPADQYVNDFSRQEMVDLAQELRLSLADLELAIEANPELLGSTFIQPYEKPELEDGVHFSEGRACVYKVEASIFGHNAVGLANSIFTRDTGKPLVVKSSIAGRATTIAQVTNLLIAGTGERDDARATESDRPFTTTIFLDQIYDDIGSEQSLIANNGQRQIHAVVQSAQAVSVDGYGLSSRVTKLVVSLVTKEERDALRAMRVMQASIYCAPKPLLVSDIPIDDPITGDTITLDRVLLRLPSRRRVAVCGERQDLPGVEVSEVREVKNVVVNNDKTTISFTSPLTYLFDRSTTRVLGNIAEAIHGESVEDILGDGDSTREFLSFSLRQLPLTHRPGISRTGLVPELEIWVGNVRWHQIETLSDAGPEDRVYELRYLEDEGVLIRFGDGKTGVKTPTGRANIVARYRRGAGPDGRVDPAQVSLPANKPSFVKEVTNPIHSSGAATSEDMDEFRQRGPMSVRSLGRVVSLLDYQDFCLAYSGVEKALAEWRWIGRSQSVVITISGNERASIKEDSRDFRNLMNGLKSSGDKRVTFSVVPCRPVEFRVDAGLYIEDDYDPTIVLTEARHKLLNRFQYSAAKLANSIRQSDIIEVLHTIDGIRGAHVFGFNREGLSGDIKGTLRGSLADIKNSNRGLPQLEGAEIIALRDEGLNLRVLA